MPASKTIELLQRYESRNVTFIDPDGSWPIVWQRARGAHVWDETGRKYLDLTAAFGVAVAGHANRNVVRAGQKQMAQLLHAMGDVHPHALKAQLAQRLSQLTFERLNAGEAKTIFTNSGFEAVEAALKTAFLATNRSGVIAFEGGYHGLGYGALNATHREHFRAPFRGQLADFASFVPFPANDTELNTTMDRVRSLLEQSTFGAVLLEPVQARGGIRIPPPALLVELRRLCDRFGSILILDEIYTGFGRTGRWFACEHSGVVPDIFCLGKALTGGFPLSACVGRSALMDRAWPPSTGEAIHTSTFLGHPVGCAMALANMAEIERLNLVERASRHGDALLRLLQKVQSQNCSVQARGIGLMAGIELTTRDSLPATDVSLKLIKNLLARGFIFLPEGEAANVIAFTPPLTISMGQLRAAVRACAAELQTL